MIKSGLIDPECALANIPRKNLQRFLLTRCLSSTVLAFLHGKIFTVKKPSSRSQKPNNNSGMIIVEHRSILEWGGALAICFVHIKTSDGEVQV